MGAMGHGLSSFGVGLGAERPRTLAAHPCGPLALPAYPGPTGEAWPSTPGRASVSGAGCPSPDGRGRGIFFFSARGPRGPDPVPGASASPPMHLLTLEVGRGAWHGREGPSAPGWGAGLLRAVAPSVPPRSAGASGLLQAARGSGAEPPHERAAWHPREAIWSTRSSFRSSSSVPSALCRKGAS